MLAEQIDGLLITTVQKDKKTIRDLQQTDLPFVLLGRYFEALDTNYVVTDDVRGAYSATEHLISQGHKKIAMINGPTHVFSAVERLKGFKKALPHNGMDFKSSYDLSEAVTLKDGCEIAKELLSSDREISAIFCYSDFIAFNVLQAAREAELRIPWDIAIMGYNNSFFSKSLEVPLTTVRIPKKVLSKHALESLLELIRQLQDEGPYQHKLAPELMIRKSA